MLNMNKCCFIWFCKKVLFSAGTWMYLWPAHPYWEALFFFTIRCFFGYENRWLVCMPKCFFCRMCTRSKGRKVGLVDVQRKRLSIRQSYSNMTLFWYHVVGNSSFGIPVYHPYGRFDCPRSLGWGTQLYAMLDMLDLGFLSFAAHRFTKELMQHINSPFWSLMFFLMSFTSWSYLTKTYLHTIGAYGKSWKLDWTQDFGYYF